MKQTGSFNWIKECDRLEKINKELLEACKYAITALTRLEQIGNHTPWVVDSYDIINQAITKAEGGKIK